MIKISTNGAPSMSKVEVLTKGDKMELSSKHVDSLLLALSYAIEEGYFAEDVELKDSGLKILYMSKGDYTTCTHSVRKNLLGGDFPMIKDVEEELETPVEFVTYEEEHLEEPEGGDVEESEGEESEVGDYVDDMETPEDEDL